MDNSISVLNTEAQFKTFPKKTPNSESIIIELSYNHLRKN